MLARAIIAMVVVLLWGCSCSPAAGVVHLDGATTELPLTPFLSFYRDASGQMTLAQVQQQWPRGQFSPGTQHRPSFGFTEDAITLTLICSDAIRIAAGYGAPAGAQPRSGEETD